jgi:hypothetical protein
MGLFEANDIIGQGITEAIKNDVGKVWAHIQDFVLCQR